MLAAEWVDAAFDVCLNVEILIGFISAEGDNPGKNPLQDFAFSLFANFRGALVTFPLKADDVDALKGEDDFALPNKDPSLR